MRFGHRHFLGSMLITLVVIGILQFFDLPTYIDYVLLVVAVVLGILAIITRRR